ncbi:MAG: hypothetical protein ACTSQJ_00265 [Promethearchaeota archaeon]
MANNNSSIRKREKPTIIEKNNHKETTLKQLNQADQNLSRILQQVVNLANQNNMNVQLNSKNIQIITREIELIQKTINLLEKRINWLEEQQ